MSRSRSPTDPQRRDLSWIPLVAATLVISTSLAVRCADGGAPWPLACLMGAAYGVFTVYLCLWAYGSLRRLIWRVRRGYPFANGRGVQVTGGEQRGRQGRVVGRDQGEWDYLVEFNDVGEKRIHRIPASKLKAAEKGEKRG